MLQSSIARAPGAWLAAFVAFVMIGGLAGQPAQAQTTMRVGMNSVYPSYSTTCMMFTDVDKVFYEWRNKSGHPAVTFDHTTGELLTGFPSLSNWQDWPYSGWAQGTNGHYPAGVYDLVFDGDADVHTGTYIQKISSNHYQFTAVADPNTGLVTNGFPILYLTRNNPNNLYRNAHFYLPGYMGDTRTWLPDFVTHVALFNGAYREKDLTLTDSCSATVTNWGTRTLPTQVRWGNDSKAGRRAPTGVPYEALIDLHNQTNVDMWINIPFSATDAYVTNLAQLLQTTLNSNLKIYIEYSNEVWNTNYQAGKMASTMYPPGNHDNFYGQTSWYSYRSEQIFRLFEGVFGETSPQLVRVIAGQFVWPARQNFLLQEANLFCNGHKAADVLAVAPYFPEHFTLKVVDSNGNVIVTLDQLFAALHSNIDNTVRADIRNNLAVANSYNVQLVGYEGGQGLVGKWPAENQFYITATRDSRMYDTYIQYLDMLEAEGMSMIELFNDIEQPSRFGIYGHAENTADANDPSHANCPKLRATLDFINGVRAPSMQMPPPRLAQRRLSGTKQAQSPLGSPRMERRAHSR
jgi:hypothetical protein